MGMVLRLLRRGCALRRDVDRLSGVASEVRRMGFMLTLMAGYGGRWKVEVQRSVLCRAGVASRFCLVLLGLEGLE